MDYSTLDELVAIPKKSNAPKAKIALYLEEIEKLLKEEGISEKAASYLRAGFPFAGALPVAEYLKDLPDQLFDETVCNLCVGDLFRGENIVSFKYAVSLMGYSVTCFAERPLLLKELIKIIPLYAYSKDKKSLLKDAPKIVEKYFFTMLKPETVLPELSLLELKDAFLRDFCRVMQSCTNQAEETSIQLRKRVERWLSYARPENTDKQSDSAQYGSASDKIQISDIGGKTETPTIELGKPFSQGELKSVISSLSIFSERLTATAALWATIKEEADAKQQKLDAVRAENTHIQQKLEKTLAEKDKLVTEAAEHATVISDLQIQLHDAKEEIKTLQANIATLQGELEKLKSVLSVYSADKQNTQTERLNAIASSLKSEYRDFIDAENEEMTLDLGENFRFQLQSVFRILAKAGVDVGKR